MAINRVEMEDYRVLITIFRQLLRGDSNAARETLLSGSLAMDRLRALLFSNHLDSHFYCLVTDQAIVDTLNEDLRERLDRRHQRQVARHKRLLQLLALVRDRFDAQAIDFLVMKGFYLSQTFVGDVNSRFMWDLDVLVKPADLGRAVGVIEEAGLHRKSRIDLDPRNAKWGLHAVELKGGLGSIDIHSAIRNLPKVEIDYELIWRETVEFEVDGESFPSLDQEGTLLISALGVATDIQCSHHNLRKILDIYMMLRRMDRSVNWEHFFQRREADGTHKLILNVFAFCMKLLETEDEFPNLCQAMGSRQDLVRVKSRDTALAIFKRGRQNIANRIFFSRLLPVSPLHYWAWWLGPLPIRYWYYRYSQ